jgi:hypothetical protein
MLWRVFYPDGEIGLMLYMKLSVTATNPSSSSVIERFIRTFRTKAPDQFFDEEQFEAYRHSASMWPRGCLRLAVDERRDVTAQHGRMVQELAGQPARAPGRCP